VKRLPRVALLLAALPVLAAAAAATLALLTRDGGPRPLPPPAAGATRAPAPAAPVAMDGRGPRVAYTGPRRLRGPSVLRAHAKGQGVVAVTFTLGGRPLGTDTTAPYGLDIDAGGLPRGRHRLRVEAVDRLGRRGRSRAIAVTTGGRRARAIVATPANGLAPALAALRAGGVTVRLGPGRYAVSDVVLGPGSRLVGAGPRTMLVPPPGLDDWSLITIRGSGVRITDLAVDGAARIGRAIAVADGSSDVRLQRLAVTGMRENGIEAWGAHSGLSVQDARITGGGRANAGVFDLGSDASSDTSVVRTRIAGFRGFGVLFAQSLHGRPAAALRGVALDNVITDIHDPERQDGTAEGGIWSGGVEAAIIGNTIRRTGVDGIETVGSSTGTAVVRNDIADTPVGIYLEHATNQSLIAANRIARVSTGINVEWRHGGVGSSANTFARNLVREARVAGLFVDVGSDDNRIVENVFVGGRVAIVLQGSSRNLLRGNWASGPLLHQRSAHFDDGSHAAPLDNRIVEDGHARSRGTG
jgi:parallel beta-helix repeat protein